MIEIGIGLASDVGARSIQTALEKLDPDAVRRAGYRFGHGAVTRREVASLFRRAYQQAIDVLRRRDTTRVQEQIGEGSPEAEAVLAAYGQLRELGKELFAPEAAKAAPAAAQPPTTEQTVQGLLAAIEPVPKPVARSVQTHFPIAFAYVFHQVTMRADDATWARMHHALLAAVKKSFEVPEDRVQKISDRLHRLDSLLERSDAFLSFRAEFQAHIDAVLPRAETQVMSFADAQRIAEMAADPDVEVPKPPPEGLTPTRKRRRKDDPGPVRAYAVVKDEQGNTVSRHPLHDGVTTVGRTEENALQLADLTVSSRHALIRVVTEENGSTTVVLRDLGSTNGSFFMTKKGPYQIREVKLSYGDVVSLGGALQVEIVSPEEHAPASGKPAKKGLMGRIFGR